MITSKVRIFLRRSIVPLALSGVFVLLMILDSWGIGIYPNDIFPIIGQRPDVVAIVAIAENLSVINMWFPGSIVIISSMASTSGEPMLAIQMYVAIVCGSIVGQHGNYLIGRIATVRTNEFKAKSLRQIRSKIRTQGWWTIFIGAMWHPQTGSIASLFAGVEGLEYREFAPRMLGAGLLWSVAWGVTLYMFGHAVDIASHFDVIVVIYIAAWLAYNAWIVSRQEP